MKEKVKIGGYTFEFHYKENRIKKTFCLITSNDGTFEMRIGGNTFTYGYLYAAMKMNREEQLHGFAVTLNTTAMMLPQDEQFVADIHNAITSWVGRVIKEGETRATEVTETQLESDEALMKEIVNEINLSDEDRIVESLRNRAIMRDVLNNTNENGENKSDE